MRRSLQTCKRNAATFLAHSSVRIGKGFLFAFLICSGWTTLVASAQTGGQGALEGTVTDQTKAVIPHAVVVATNQASGVSTTHTTTSAGVYQISPLIPGI